MYWSPCDITQEFEAAKLLSLSRGYGLHQSMAYAKYTVWAYKQRQLKHFFRKECLACGKDISYTSNECHVCGETRFKNIPQREWVRNVSLPMKSRVTDSIAISLELIELAQFREFIKPYWHGQYLMFIFDALVDGHTQHGLLALIPAHFVTISKIICRLKKLYKSFSDGITPVDTVKTICNSKMVFVYRHGEAAVRQQRKEVK